MPNLVNDFEVRKETLRALGGNPDGLANIFEVDKEILKILSEGGVGIDWDTIKQKLAEDGVESIKFTMGNEEVILTAEEVKTLLNQPIHDGKYMTMTVDESNTGETTISPTVTGSLPNLNLQYRINNGDWTDFIVGTTADIHVVSGDVVQWKGNNPDGVSTNYNDYLNFSISGNPVSLSGNVMSLIDGIGDTLVIPNKFCFKNLFYNSVIKTVSSDFLPATTLKEECYRSLFSYCSNLTQAPALPATTLERYCYNEMFSGCNALTTAPELPATTLVNSCYNYMFQYCSSLNYVQCRATDNVSTDAIYNWLNGVSSTGTFVKPDGVSYETGVNGIPSGWTVKESDMIEVPMDGNQYARQDGAWVEVSKVKTTNNTTMQFWNGTQQEYDAIATKDANTLYIIK